MNPVSIGGGFHVVHDRVDEESITFPLKDLDILKDDIGNIGNEQATHDWLHLLGGVFLGAGFSALIAACTDENNFLYLWGGFGITIGIILILFSIYINKYIKSSAQRIVRDLKRREEQFKSSQMSLAGQNLKDNADHEIEIAAAVDNVKVYPRTDTPADRKRAIM